MTNIISESSKWRYIPENYQQSILSGKTGDTNTRDNKVENIYGQPIEQFTNAMEQFIDPFQNTEYARKVIPTLLDDNMTLGAFDKLHGVSTKITAIENLIEKDDAKEKKILDGLAGESPGEHTNNELLKIQDKRQDHFALALGMDSLNTISQFMYNDDFLKDKYKRHIEILDGDQAEKENEFITNLRGMLKTHIKDDIMPHINEIGADKSRGI